MECFQMNTSFQAADDLFRCAGRLDAFSKAWHQELYLSLLPYVWY